MSLTPVVALRHAFEGGAVIQTLGFLAVVLGVELLVDAEVGGVVADQLIRSADVVAVKAFDIAVEGRIAAALNIPLALQITGAHAKAKLAGAADLNAVGIIGGFGVVFGGTFKIGKFVAAGGGDVGFGIGHG